MVVLEKPLSRVYEEIDMVTHRHVLPAQNVQAQLQRCQGGVKLHPGEVGKGQLRLRLDSRVFAGQKVSTIAPDPADAAGFNAYIKRFAGAMPVEKAAVEYLKSPGCTG